MLPKDILILILREITDSRTWINISTISKKLHELCDQQLVRVKNIQRVTSNANYYTCALYEEWRLPYRENIATTLPNGILHGWITEYQRNRLRFRHTFRDGLIHGIYHGWDLAGKPEHAWSFKNGALHGICYTWFSDGKIKIVNNFDHGKLHGPYYTWASNGVPVSLDHYQQSKRVGPNLEWHGFGEVKVSIHMVFKIEK